MTAFAAILPRAEARVDAAGITRAAAALSGIYGIAPVPLVLDGCALLTAPVDRAASRHPFVDRESGVAAVGQVLLEDTESLARELGVRAPVDLALVVSAFLRWGIDGTDRLSGEFAFTLWNPRDRSLLSARDGLGIRLLYVAEGTDAIVVTNVLSAAVSHPSVPGALDQEALISFLAHGEPGCGRTAYRAVQSLPAGHTLRLARGGSVAALRRHWWFPQSTRPVVRREEEILEGYRAILQAAVTDRVREGRTSILMSGGVDSTTIAAAARAGVAGLQAHAFTAVYERVPAASELQLAEAAGRTLGIAVTSVVADRHDALHVLGTGAPTPQPLDEPALTDWRRLTAAAASYSTVALYGEDGDSLFLPPGFDALRRAQSLSALSTDVRRYAWTERRLPYLGLRLRERIGLARTPSHLAMPRWLADAARSALGNVEPPPILGQRSTRLPPHPTRPRTQARLTEAVPQYLSTIISAEVTRQPVELRCPLLDTRVLQFVIDAPAIPWCQRKRLPRQAYRHLLPDAILDRPKTGVVGLEDALVRAWQQTRNRRGERLAAPLDAWVDMNVWSVALDAHDSGIVTTAWRVLELDAWLKRRHEPLVTQDHACTA